MRRMQVGRFQIMALLQAARAFVLGLPLESAKSWGLNRAIFFAAAKRGFKGGSPMTGEFPRAKTGRPEPAVDVFRLGDDMAFREERQGRLYFTIGGQIQTEADFARQVEQRFGPVFAEAWKEALAFIKRFDRSTLESQNAFFNGVYRPIRDEWAAKWSERVAQQLARTARPRKA